MTFSAVRAVSPLALAMVLLCGCGSEPRDEPSAGQRAADPGTVFGDGISVDGARYPLASAVAEVWGENRRYREHFNVDFTLTDGSFELTPIVVDGIDVSLREPVQATAVFTAELYSANSDAFAFARYDFVATPEKSASTSGRHFFINGRLGVDSDASGDVEELEYHSIIDGQIDFVGPPSRLSMDFTVVLDNGMVAAGHYEGLFEFDPRG